ncbi:MAG: pilus assembly protein PilM [bacterium]|nr:pilus assembly protein PilM [bacterium]
MALFSKDKKNEHYLGVDLGASGIKLVELVNDKTHARLMTYGYVNLPKESRSLLEDPDRASDLLKKITEKARCTTKRSIAALPISSVFTSLISIQKAKEKEMKEAIAIQARKLLPMPLEDVVLDTTMIDAESGEVASETTGQKGWMRVLITAAPKTLVSSYQTIFQKAGLELLALETEVFAHVRSLIGKDRSTIMLVDSGIERTNITVVEKGIPFLTRSIATGGRGVTEAISRTMGVTLDQAETMKKDIRSLQSTLPGEDLSVILDVLVKPILEEITYTFQLWKDDAKHMRTSGRIDKIILTGGGTLLPGLTDFITKRTNVNAYLGDPWARVITPEKMRPVLDEVGSRFSVSLGCAMREIE